MYLIGVQTMFDGMQDRYAASHTCFIKQPRIIFIRNFGQFIDIFGKHILVRTDDVDALFEESLEDIPCIFHAAHHFYDGIYIIRSIQISDVIGQLHIRQVNIPFLVDVVDEDVADRYIFTHQS